MSNRKPYVQAQPRNWWLKNPFYVRYMIREGTSIFVFLYSLILMWGVFSVAQGEAAFVSWLGLMSSPLFLLLHLVVLAATLIHVVTWFSLTPKIMPVRFGSFKLSDQHFVLGQYGALVAVSLMLILLAINWF